MSAGPSLRVVVRIPTARPENAIADPPQIEWTPEKADILWKVIERSRSTDSGGADWKGLAAHLEVPLPYLLYRVNARFQEEIRGLKDIQGTLGPSAALPPPSLDAQLRQAEKPTAIQRMQTRLSGSTRLATSSSRLNTPLGVRARLDSLTNNLPKPKKPNAIASSTLTLQASNRSHNQHREARHRAGTPDSSGSDTDSSAEYALKEEEAERVAEEQEALDRKLEELQKMMTSETIGLVSNPRPRRRSQILGSTSRSNGSGSPRSSRLGALSTRSNSQSQSVSTSAISSSAGSPQGSIPDIPSPNGDMSPQPRSPLGRRGRYGHTSPPTASRRSTVGYAQSHLAHPQSDEYPTSSYGSEASSFSDLSDASLSVSGSALESALMSNIRGGGSRFSQFPSRMGSRLPR